MREVPVPPCAERRTHTALHCTVCTTVVVLASIDDASAGIRAPLVVGVTRHKPRALGGGGDITFYRPTPPDARATRIIDHFPARTYRLEVAPALGDDQGIVATAVASRFSSTFSPDVVRRHSSGIAKHCSRSMEWTRSPGSAKLQPSRRRRQRTQSRHRAHLFG